MAYDVTQDHAALLADLGVTVTPQGGAAFQALFEQRGQIVTDPTGQELKLEDTAILYPATVPALTDNQQVAVTGVGTFYVRDVLPIDDGKWRRALLA